MGLLELDDDDEECGVGHAVPPASVYPTSGFEPDADLDDADGAANRARCGGTLDAQSDACSPWSLERHVEPSINGGVLSGQREGSVPAGRQAGSRETDDRNDCGSGSDLHGTERDADT